MHNVQCHRFWRPSCRLWRQHFLHGYLCLTKVQQGYVLLLKVFLVINIHSWNSKHFIKRQLLILFSISSNSNPNKSFTHTMTYIHILFIWYCMLHHNNLKRPTPYQGRYWNINTIIIMQWKFRTFYRLLHLNVFITTFF